MKVSTLSFSVIKSKINGTPVASIKLKSISKSWHGSCFISNYYTNKIYKFRRESQKLGAQYHS